MTRRATILRVLRRTAVGLLVLFLVVNAVLYVAARRFQSQAERLMADVQTLKLHQSTWPEAQRLFTRWGKYGHYDGTCDASFCRYNVTLDSPAERVTEAIFSRIHSYPQALIEPVFVIINASHHLSGKYVTFQAALIVQDGTVVRKAVGLQYFVPSSFADRLGYTLSILSRSDLRVANGDWWLSREDLAVHPHYLMTHTKRGMEVHFALDTPEDEMRSLTTFKLDCIASLRPCRTYEDLFPVSDQWHTYDGIAGSRHPTKPKTQEKAGLKPCQIPLWALGRETGNIVSVTSLGPSKTPPTDPDILATAKIRFDEVVRGEAPYKPGQVVDIQTYKIYSPMAVEPPIEGRHYLILYAWPFNSDDAWYVSRCLLHPDTPEVRRQLLQGTVKEDKLRVAASNPDDFSLFSSHTAPHIEPVE